jgi:hypothetical protein
LQSTHVSKEIIHHLKSRSSGQWTYRPCLPSRANAALDEVAAVYPRYFEWLQFNRIIFLLALQAAHFGSTLKSRVTCDTISSGAYQQQSASSSAHSTDRQLTVMLVTICVVALILQTPYIVFYIVNESKYDWLEEENAAFELLQDAVFVSLSFSTLNYAVNFLLYYVSGSSFRSHVVRLQRRCRQRCCRLFTTRDTNQRRSSSAIWESYVLRRSRASATMTSPMATGEQVPDYFREIFGLSEGLALTKNHC